MEYYACIYGGKQSKNESVDGGRGPKAEGSDQVSATRDKPQRFQQPENAALPAA
jgi:hypothetical protein